MTTISAPRLVISPDPGGRPGTRLLCLDYDVHFERDDPCLDHALVERITVRAVDEHDAPVEPAVRPVLEHTGSFTAAASGVHRRIERAVRRIELDVEGDWWASSDDGQPIPIAEWFDHLVADIWLLDGGTVIANAATPVVTGSWGALGQD